MDGGREDLKVKRRWSNEEKFFGLRLAFSIEMPNWEGRYHHAGINVHYLVRSNGTSMCGKTEFRTLEHPSSS
jgi:hypothetical protein